MWPKGSTCRSRCERSPRSPALADEAQEPVLGGDRDMEDGACLAAWGPHGGPAYELVGTGKIPTHCFTVHRLGHGIGVAG
jgi:hypothetical protein